MSENKVGSVPDFTADETVVEGTEEVKPVEETVEETETPAELPSESEKPEQKPAEEAKAPLRDDTESIPDEILGKAVARATEGLRHEIVALKKDLATAKGADRMFIQGKIETAQDKIDELKDVAPEDVSLIDRVLRAKGYITKEESSKMHYDAVKNEEITKFLDKFPEYKPENDPSDLNWSALQKQVQSWYRMPGDPRLVGELLLKAHKDIVKTPSDRGTVEVKKQQVKVASSGSAGTQRSSPKPSNPRLTELMRSHMQGWSEEEINKLEKKLPE